MKRYSITKATLIPASDYYQWPLPTQTTQPNISSIYLDKAQQMLTMFSTLFEKYKSDGVEHNLYIGQSMNNKVSPALFAKSASKGN